MNEEVSQSDGERWAATMQPQDLDQFSHGLSAGLEDPEGRQSETCRWIQPSIGPNQLMVGILTVV